MYVVTFELPNGDYRLKRLHNIPKTTQVLLDGRVYSIVKSTWNLDMDDQLTHIEMVLEYV